MSIIYSNKKLPARKDYDLYPTPHEFCRSALYKLVPSYISNGIALDAGAGDGVWGRSLKEVGWTGKVHGVELRDVHLPDSYDVWYSNTDYLTFKSDFKYDLIFGNPPFSLAEEFLDKSFELIKRTGIVFFLYRMSFLESKHRFEKYFNTIKEPSEVWVSTRRISFTGNRKSDNSAYAMYLWNMEGTESVKLDWLDWSYDE